MTGKKLIYSGLVVLAASLLIGLFGAAGGIATSFSALSDAEIMGIAGVERGIVFALIATVIGLVGSLAGICLIVAGIVRSSRSSDTK